MDKTSVKGSIRIDALPSKIWDTLTNPAKIVLYTGSTAQGSWTKGSRITWSGEIQGTKFENKGTVLENIPDTLLRFTYWSGMGGDADLPENYSEITYTLEPVSALITELSYSRTRIPTAIEQQIFSQHLQYMLEEIKRISEE